MTGFADWIAEHRQEETPAEKMSRLARQAGDRHDRQEAAAEAERAVALEEEHDRRAVAFMQAGIAGRSQTEIFAEASRVGDEDAEYEAALKTIERIGKRRGRRAEAARYQAEQLAVVSRSTAGSDTGDLLAPAKAAHAEFVRRTRVALAAAQGGVASRPFVSRGGGAAGNREITRVVTDHGNIAWPT